MSVSRLFFALTIILFTFNQNLESAWTTPGRISTTVSDQVNIAVDSSGNAQAIWQGYDGINYDIQAATLPFGGSWTTPVVLSASGQNAQAPSICVDNSGNAISIWSRYDGNNSIIQGAYLPSGGTWSSVTNISGTGFNADSPALSTNTNNDLGTAVAVWHRYNGTNFIVQSSAFSSGTWSSAFNISPSGQDALIPQVAMDPNGNAISSCARYNGSNFSSRSAMMLQGQTWSPSFVLSNPGQTGSAGSVGVDASGNGIIVWNQFDGSDYTIQASTYPYGGSWSEPTAISTTGENALIPLVKMDSVGNTTVIWVRFDGSNYIAQATTKPSGGSWTTPQNISNSGFNVNNISLALDPAGNALAVWDETDGVNSSIKSATLPLNGTWSAISSLSSSGNFAYLPSVGVDSSGNAVAIWLQSNGTSYYVWSSTLAFGS